MKDYEFKISQFVDNELPANEQRELFLFLSENEDGRKMLSDYMEMKKESKSFYTGMNTELDGTKVISAGIFAQKEKEKKYKSMSYFSAAAAILFAFLLLFNQFKPNALLTKYQNLQTEMIKLQENYSTVLNKQIELVELNTQLYEETEKLKIAQMEINKQDKKVSSVQTPEINKQQKYKRGSSYTVGNLGSKLASLKNVQRIEITKNDFLGGQIIGN